MDTGPLCGPPIMSTFYLLPPRKELARRFAGYLHTWFPGVHPCTEDLPDVLAASAKQARGVIVLFADDLPDEAGTAIEFTLVDEFGAAPCDRVFDLRDGPLNRSAGLDSWVIRGRSRAPLR